MASTRDVIIVGGGHNALVAAAYLARAGQSVTVLERLSHVGGAAVSERPWDDVDARLSRYSYLVSLLPSSIIRDLGLDIRLKRRRYSSYTPLPGDPVAASSSTAAIRERRRRASRAPRETRARRSASPTSTTACALSRPPSSPR